MRAAKKSLVFVASIGLIGVSSVTLGGLRYNTTESLPVGFYWMTKHKPSVGDVVVFCPDSQPIFSMAYGRGYIEKGICPSGYGQIFKKILAAKNDVLTVDAGGVYVNGQRVPNSQPAEQDLMANPLPQYRPKNYRLKDGEFFLMSSYHPLSFDSRYFGLVRESQIEGVAQKIFGDTNESN